MMAERKANTVSLCLKLDRPCVVVCCYDYHNVGRARTMVRKPNYQHDPPPATTATSDARGRGGWINATVREESLPHASPL
jgi:hypothetical protein